MNSSQKDWREALRLLQDGNQRFLSGVRSVEPILGALRLKELAMGQTPFASVVTCSDSRVPAEIIFDRGLGDLFVTRIAGNVIGPTPLASIEYSAFALKTSLCLVMGHTGCGAIESAVHFTQGRGDVPSSAIKYLLQMIQPSVEKAVSENSGADHKDLCMRATVHNVAQSVATLKERSPLLRQMSEEGTLQIVGAIYDIATGKVSFDVTHETLAASEAVSA